MPQIINTNLASINAQRQLDITQRSSDQALQRLSSGLRINGASDDAAGLAISNRISAQIRGTDVATRNAGDGVSLAQTAEGALNSIQDSLQRIRELALQSSNGSNTDLERTSLQEEVEQLKAEIASISEKASFNGRNLLDGSFQNVNFQTGANLGESISVNIAAVTEDTLGSAATAGVTSNVSGTGFFSAQTIASGDVVINGASVGVPVGTDDNASFSLQSSSAISKAAAINAVSETSGVTATAAENRVEGTTIAAGTASAVAAETVAINGVNITLSVAAVETEQALTNVADTINNKSDLTGVTAEVVETSTGFRVDLLAEDGRNITVDTSTAGSEDFGLAGDGTDGTVTTFLSNVTLVSDDGSDIVLSTSTGNIDNFGFEEGTFSGTNAQVVGNSSIDGTTTARAALVAGDLVVNGVSVGATKASDDTASSGSESSSAIALAAAINRVSDESNVTATANENRVYSGTVGTSGGAFNFSINGVTVSGTTVTTLSTNLSTVIDAINDVQGQTGVRAEALDDNQYTLIAEDGRNIVTAVTTAGDAGVTADSYIGGVTLSAAGAFELDSLTGSIEKAGLNVGTYGGSESGTLLKDIDISTVSGAEDAILGIDNAINQVSAAQASLGAVQNRFEATISNLAVQSENLNAANSRIRDADFAAETAELSRTQVLQQAGISILAQANARPQQALSLLQ